MASSSGSAAASGVISSLIANNSDPFAEWILIPRVHVDSTMGSFLLGTVIGLTLVFIHITIALVLTSWHSSRLFGLNGHQCYRYFRLYPHDRALFKLVVRPYMRIRVLCHVVHAVYHSTLKVVITL